MAEKYDFVIVGSGLYGACFAYLAKQQGKKCFVIEKANHIGGNLYCEEVEGITVHKYGAHIFHTSKKEVWDFVNQFVEFNPFINSPLAAYQGKLYNLPFNMNTFYQLWGTKWPLQAKEIIDSQKGRMKFCTPTNFEEQAVSMVGVEIYEKFIKGYTEKQWGLDASELPSFIIKRIPLRFSFDNNYFNDTYQGVPKGGYNSLIQGLLQDVPTRLNCDYFKDPEYFQSICKTIVYTGEIDRYFNYKFGRLDYRSLRFEHNILPLDNFQGNAVINYTDKNVPFTRIIEHKFFDPRKEIVELPSTVITHEFPLKNESGLDHPYYPVNDEKNMVVYKKYQEYSKERKNVIFGGRLAEYKYYNMNDIVENLLASYGKKD